MPRFGDASSTNDEVQGPHRYGRVEEYRHPLDVLHVKFQPSRPWHGVTAGQLGNSGDSWPNLVPTSLILSV